MTVREGILALLTEGPRHGYALKTGFEEAMGGAWSLNVGQVYTTLERLERDGLVRSEADEARTAYRLTDDGWEAVGAWWSAAPDTVGHHRDELVMKVLLAMSTAPDAALELIRRQRDRLLTLLQAYQRARRDGGPARSLAATLTHDAVEMRAEADMRWLDLCEERLIASRSEARA